MEPVKKIRPLVALDRSELYSLRGRSAVGGLPINIADRQTRAFSDYPCDDIGERVPISISVDSVPSRGEGTFLFVMPESAHGAAGFCALGAKGEKGGGGRRGGSPPVYGILFYRGSYRPSPGGPGSPISFVGAGGLNVHDFQHHRPSSDKPYGSCPSSTLLNRR